MMILFLFCLALLICAIYMVLIWPYNLEKKYELRGPPPKLLFGNYFDYERKGFHIYDQENMRKYGHIYPIYLGRIPIIVISDQLVLEQILVKNYEAFIDRPKNTGSEKLMKNTLFHLKGNDWKRVRKIVSHTFNTGNFKMMSPKIITIIQHMFEKIDKIEGTEVDVKEIFGLFTMDVLAKVLLGIELDKDSSNSFVEHASKTFNISLRNNLKKLMYLAPAITPLVDWLYPRGISSAKSIEFFEKSLTEAIKQRRNMPNENHDLLNQMLRAQDESSNENISNDELLAQCIISILAGFESIVTALSSFVYYLATNSEMQEEVYRELKQGLESEECITYGMLSKFKLLECFMLETLRICPPVMRIQRTCVKYTLITTSTGKELAIEKGMTFAVPIYAIHNDEAIWEECDKFDMRRFDSIEKRKSKEYSFLPFGKGPRACVGERFAMLAAKLALAHLMMKYKFFKCDKTPKKLTFGPSRLTKILESIIVRIERR